MAKKTTTATDDALLATVNQFTQQALVSIGVGLGPLIGIQKGPL